MIDAALVARKALLITRDLADLAPLAHTPLAEYLANVRDELVAERLLERIIGRMIDINYHVLTETEQPPPADYYPSFTQLAALGVYDVEFGAASPHARDSETGSFTSTTRLIRARYTRPWARPFRTCPRICGPSKTTCSGGRAGRGGATRVPADAARKRSARSAAACLA